MKEAFTNFRYQIGDVVKHRGHASNQASRVDAGLIVARSLHEALDAEGNPFYQRIYSVIGYGVDAESTEMEIEKAE